MCRGVGVWAPWGLRCTRDLRNAPMSDFNTVLRTFCARNGAFSRGSCQPHETDFFPVLFEIIPRSPVKYPPASFHL